MSNLKLGSSGNAVVDVQKDLIKLGYSVGPSGADGQLGAYTDSAIRKFQTDNSLTVDGIVGPQTRAKIQETLAARFPSTPTDPPRTIPVSPSGIPSTAVTKFLTDSGASMKNLITIVNTSFNPPRSINFYKMSPDDISESHTANFENEDIHGRSSPLAVFSGGGARTTNLSIDLHEDYLRMFSPQMQNTDIVMFVSQIKALTYPRYQGGVVIPPRCFIKVGEFLMMKAYCSSVNVSWKKPLRNGRYISATVSMEFSEILSISFSADEIASGGDVNRYYQFPG
jgi:hypothetical protein